MILLHEHENDAHNLDLAQSAVANMADLAEAIDCSADHLTVGSQNRRAVTEIKSGLFALITTLKLLADELDRYALTAHAAERRADAA